MSTDATTHIGDSFDSLARQPCIGCGGHTGGMLGHFVPNAACRRRDLGIVPDRPAQVVYPVCERCARRSGTDPAYVERIEHRILARWRAARALSRRSAHALRLLTVD